MAQTELANGSNAGAKTLAQRIEDAQTTVVDTIWRLFQWPPTWVRSGCRTPESHVEEMSMPIMSAVESSFCRSVPWRSFARRVVLPWALNGHELAGAVLEIGGGSGAMADGVARTHPEVSLTVTDVDEAMVRSAQARLSAHQNVTVEVADVTALPYETATFAAVTSYLMLHHVIDWEPALAEAARVVRPGGVFLGYDLTNSRLARLVHQVDRSPFRLLAPAELGNGLAAAGFTDVELDVSFASHLVRFRARKPEAP